MPIAIYEGRTSANHPEFIDSRSQPGEKLRLLAANSSDERMPFLCSSASRSILAKMSVSWALSGRCGSLTGAVPGSGVLACAPSTETTGRVETLTVPR